MSVNECMCASDCVQVCMYVPVYMHVCVHMCLGKWEWESTRVCGRVCMSWHVIMCRCAQANLHVFAALWTVSKHVLGLCLPSGFDLCPGPWLSCGLGGPPGPSDLPFLLAGRADLLGSARQVPPGNL